MTETVELLRGICISGSATFSGTTQVRLDPGTDLETPRGRSLLSPQQILLGLHCFLDTKRSSMKRAGGYAALQSWCDR